MDLKTFVRLTCIRLEPEVGDVLRRVDDVMIVLTQCRHVTTQLGDGESGGSVSVVDLQEIVDAAGMPLDREVAEAEVEDLKQKYTDSLHELIMHHIKLQVSSTDFSGRGCDGPSTTGTVRVGFRSLRIAQRSGFANQCVPACFTG